MRRGQIAALLATSLYLGAAPAAAASLREVRYVDRVDRHCDQVPPEVVPPPAITPAPVLPVEARVLYEAGHLPAVRDHMNKTRYAFRRIGIRLRLSYDEVDPPDEWALSQLGGPRERDIMEFVKAHYGGRRPPGVDVVYYMTRHWSGGFADCIGGVAHPGRAFAFGALDYSLDRSVPSAMGDEGVLAAHELGHLLGAEHHYANCVEALPSGAPRGEMAPCTVMTPLIDGASSTFGLLEASYVRYYVERYAKG